MRVAAIYDIHGNLPALEAVLQEIRQEKVDHIVVGGDVLPGPMPRETLELLRDLDPPAHFIYGNGEIAVLQQMAGKEPAVSQAVRPHHQLDGSASSSRASILAIHVANNLNT